ncbi:MAG TPA: LysE family translocator [Candidatus Eisenbacteria bacterium]|nr:LysE family translocator [Candidatus Eisenbacteria bacterium]
MILDPSSLGVFVFASVLLILAPGPDVIFLISQSIGQGPRAGFLVALGLACGNLVHTCLAALGISVVFRASPVAFQGLKIAGVAYLLYLAWKAVHGSKAEDAGDAPEAPHTGLFLRGVFMNVLNPKVALFFLAFLPQFVDPKAGPVWAQLALYGVIFTALVVLIFGTIGLSAGYIGRRVGTRSVGTAGWGRWLVALVYAALAARLAFVHQ